MEHFLTQTASHLWHQSWQIAAVFAAVASACWLLRSASAHGRYLLWLIVLAKCLVPPLVTVPLAVLPAAEPPEEQWEVAAANATRAAAPSDGPAPPSPVDPPAEAPKETTAPPVGAPPATGRTAPSRWTVRQWAAAGWIAGASAFLLFFLLKACRIQRRLGRTCRPASRYLQSEAADVSRRLGLGRPARLYLVDGLAQPFVWGLLRGSVFLPADLGEVTTAEQRRAILGHELAHVARWDALLNVAQTIAQGIFFFHPLVWWANRQIRREREKCCDETAIAVLASPPGQYGSAIVEALITDRKSSRALSSLAVVGPVKALEERIRTIMTPNRRFHRRPTWQAVLCALLLAALAVPGSVVLTASAKPPEPPGPGRGDVEMVPCVRKYSVMLVVGPDRMTFQGRDVTWEKLPAALQQVAHRERTVLAVAVADRSHDNEDKRKELMSLAARAAKGLHFDHLSFTGVHPMGSKGEARFEPTLTPADLDARRAKAAKAAGPLLGTWRGVVPDKAGEGISMDLLTLELKIDSDGRLMGIATGRFVRQGEQRLEELNVRDGRLDFVVLHRTGVRVEASLRVKGNALRGDCTPVGTTEDPCDILLERQPGGKRGLAGIWYGLAIDKPGQGTSVDAIVVELPEAKGGEVAGAAYGYFSQSSAQELKKLRAEDGAVEFEMIHRTGMRMKVTLKVRDGKLVGEAVPIDVDDDACDITLQRPVKGAKEPRGHQFFGTYRRRGGPGAETGL